MRVGVDARMLCSSGIGKVIENIVSRMIADKPEWHFVLLGKMSDFAKFSFTKKENVELISCNAPIYSVREQFEVPWKLPKDLDVLWCPHYNVPVFYHGRMVVTIHDLAHLALPEINKGFLKQSYAKIMFRAATKKADQIACVSKFTISELKKYVPSVDAKKIHLVYNGVDEKWFSIKKGKPVHDKPYFIFVGNVKPHKNLRRLIEAYKLASMHIKQDLILVGKKEGFINGENSISELIKGFEDRIIFTGYVSDEELMQYVAQADAMIFPSLYEGFGLPPLEAMAAGIPVLASDAASIPEVCQEDAIYFDPLDINDIKENLVLFSFCKIEPLHTSVCSFTWDKAYHGMEILLGENLLTSLQSGK